MTAYNQNVVKNPYIQNLWSASRKMHQPFWGKKLITPSFFREEKLPKFYRQWASRLGLEIIKMRHAIEYRPGDQQQAKAM
jgi:hypothetical protein